MENSAMSASFLRHTWKSLLRARTIIFSVFLVYLLSCLVGTVAVHTGVSFAVSQRDSIVRKAVSSDETSISYRKGNRFEAALRDFAGNALFAALVQTVEGLVVVPAYISVAYQGWVGGIVSIDGEHQSRLRTWQTATYYLLVLFLQYVAYSTAIGAGIRLGIDLYKDNSQVGWDLRRYRIRKERLMSFLGVYLVSLPVFAIASTFEFFSTWN